MDTSETAKDDEPKPKLPYEPPAVVSEETFETLAIACAKMSGPSCVLSGVNS